MGNKLSTLHILGIKVVHNHSPHGGMVLTEVFINSQKPSLLLYGEAKPTLEELTGMVCEWQASHQRESSQYWAERANEEGSLKP